VHDCRRLPQAMGGPGSAGERPNVQLRLPAVGKSRGRREGPAAAAWVVLGRTGAEAEAEP
jgi:hypothetical protein